MAHTRHFVTRHAQHSVPEVYRLLQKGHCYSERLLSLGSHSHWQPLKLLIYLQVPGIYKIRYIGQTTLSSAAVSLTTIPPAYTLLHF